MIETEALLYWYLLINLISVQSKSNETFWMVHVCYIPHSSIVIAYIHL